VTFKAMSAKKTQ